MSKKFFESWQLWEKMCFVLACGILAVIGLGCLKLVYNHWRLRKYTALAAAKAAQRQEMQQTASVQRRRGAEVPFGVRAIESGIEVDGVWISRSNTPAPSVPDSPISSASVGPSPVRRAESPDRTSSTSNISRLEIPLPVHGYPGALPVRSGPSSAVVNVPFERGLSAERPPSGHSPIALDYGSRSHTTYQPRRSSHLRFSNSQDVENAAAMAVLEGRLLNQRRNVSDESYESSKDQTGPGSWSASLGSVENVTPRKSREVEPRSNHAWLEPGTSQLVSANNENHPDSLSTQERSNAARSQIVPQIRLSGVENDWTPGTHPAEHKYYFAGPPSPLYEGNNDDPFKTPSSSPKEDGVKPITSPENQGHDVPKPRFSLSDEDEAVPPPRAGQGAQIDGMTPQSRKSQVVRKVNSGFEILRPGTLDRPQTSRNRNSGHDIENGGNLQTKKLHKKTRDSLPLRESRFVEGA